jgi:hypothetical protein
MTTVSLSKPNDQSGTSFPRHLHALPLRPLRAKLREAIRGLLGDEGRGVVVYEGRCVCVCVCWDSDYDQTLERLSVTRGRSLTLLDEEGDSCQ